MVLIGWNGNNRSFGQTTISTLFFSFTTIAPSLIVICFALLMILQVWDKLENFQQKILAKWKAPLASSQAFAKGYS